MSSKRHGEELVFIILRAVKKAGYLTMGALLEDIGQSYEADKIRRTAYRLKNKGYMGGTAGKGYRLSDKGNRRLNELDFKHLEQAQPWDHIWRLVIYDIPETHRSERNTVRKLIKQLGFKLLQQSVWVHPLPCLEQFELLRDSSGLHKEIILLEAPDAPVFQELYRTFKKTYPKL